VVEKIGENNLDAGVTQLTRPDGAVTGTDEKALRPAAIFLFRLAGCSGWNSLIWRGFQATPTNADCERNPGRYTIRRVLKRLVGIGAGRVHGVANIHVEVRSSR
jgi:hypothetical protein